MKIVTIGLLAILGAMIAQAHFIGLNGLTILTIPMTIYLGFWAIDRVLEQSKKSNK